MKKLDKKLYQAAYRQYQQYNEAEFIERVRNAGKLSPAEAFQRYVALVEFCWKLCPEQSAFQRQQKLAAIEEYQEKIKKFESWRRAHGKTS